MMNEVNVGGVAVGSRGALTIIAGPCVAESAELCLRVAEAMKNRCEELGLGFIFKASFDKANRSSIRSPRGPGLEQGLAILDRVAGRLGVPVTTDIHEPHQAPIVAEVVDLLQIPAFLCRQTDLLVAAAATGKPVNVKKGQYISPREMANAVAKLLEATDQEPSVCDNALNEPEADKANKPHARLSEENASGAGVVSGGGVILTERGTFFGYHRLVNDFVGLADLMDLGWPVCFDATHSTQLPGGGEAGAVSGGRPQRAAVLARCAVAAGVAAVFIETHPEPVEAMSDASSMLPLDQAAALLDDLAQLHRVARSMR